MLKFFMAVKNLTLPGRRIRVAIPVIMPKQGQSVESCIISKWHKKKGDEVKAGDMLLTYETDKAAFDEEARDEGIILDIFFEEGDDVPVLTNICVIGLEGEDPSQFDPRKQGHQKDKDIEIDIQEGFHGNMQRFEKPIRKTADSPESLAEVMIETKNLDTMAGLDSIKISPRAKKLAEKSGIDYRYAKPTGPSGRIIERDIISLKEAGPIFTLTAKDQSSKIRTEDYVRGSGLGGRLSTEDIDGMARQRIIEGQPTTDKYFTTESKGDIVTKMLSESSLEVDIDESDFTEVKLTNIRKIIGKQMHQSLSTTAQLTLNTTFDASEILDYRRRLKENREKLGIQNITINDIVLFAVTRTLLKHKSLNAHFLDDKILLFNSVHMGVAVDTERGLMVPTLFNADKKTLNEISVQVKRLAESCQKGTINPDLLQGGTFTVTNLGMLDVESFTPVLNPPQTGILGVNNIIQRAKVVDNEHRYYPAMGLSLTFDHRAVDGAPAARFLKELKINLENFSVLLAK